MRRNAAHRGLAVLFTFTFAFTALDVVIGLRPTTLLVQTAASTASAPNAMRLKSAISFPQSRSAQPLDGRIVLVIPNNNKREPRFQNNVYQADTQLADPYHPSLANARIGSIRAARRAGM